MMVDVDAVSFMVQIAQKEVSERIVLRVKGQTAQLSAPANHTIAHDM